MAIVPLLSECITFVFFRSLSKFGGMKKPWRLGIWLALIEKHLICTLSLVWYGTGPSYGHACKILHENGVVF